jgi:serine phosphatase RsbU (regulator of sigma subunit)
MRKPIEILNEFEHKLLAQPSDKARVEEIIYFAQIYGDCFGDKIVPILERGIELSRKIDYVVGETLSFCNLAFFSRVSSSATLGKYTAGVKELEESVERTKGHELYPMGLNMLGYFHWFRGEYELAFNTIFKSFKLLEGTNTEGEAWNHFALAVFYFDTKDFENSRLNYQRSFDIFSHIEHEYGRARAANGLGTVAIVQNRIKDALPLLEFAAGGFRKANHHAGLSRAMNDMGLLEKANGNYVNAIEYLKESIDLRRDIDHIQGLITSCTELGEIYLIQKHHTQALEQFEKAMLLSVEVKAAQKQMRLHKLFYDTFKELNNTDQALQNFEKFFEIKSQLLSDEAANNIRKVQTAFEKEKSEREAELERIRNAELQKANTIIEQKNKDITDSINYAKRIQLGILPSKEVLDKCFDNYFVLYKPKDIVSGDFYWAVESSDRETDTKLSIIAAVDCTGHGVPGAFMSMLGNTLLNQTITNPKVRSAADVLNYLNRKLPENLKATGAEQNIRDGMDMTLCIFDLKNMRMQFAGANNPIWIIRNRELIELKGDKQPISASTDSEKKDFTNQTFQLKKDDHVYLFTDGYADQFGGPKEKKFSYKRLKELLMENVSKTPGQQKEVLLSAFNDWKGELEQIDDVCVIGIRI